MIRNDFSFLSRFSVPLLPKPLLHAHPRGIVAIVTHDSVLRVLLCHVMGLPLSSYWLFDPTPCGISVVSHNENRFIVHSINETQHLLTA